ncbi:MAG: lysophospholipid acyltransferase family protein [Acidobacteriota bacterium]
MPLIIAVTLVAHGTIILSALTRRLAPRWQMRVRNAAFRRWARQMCRLLGLRLQVEGPAPDGRFVLVTNHVSYVDIMALGACVDAAFVAKADLRGWPILGWIFQTADTIFVDRTRKRDLLRVIENVDQTLERDLGVLFFPEGTSGKGDQILRFRPSLLELAASRNYPVHYATLSYRAPAGESAQDKICWWGDASFVPHFLKLLELPYFEATLTFGARPIRAENRKALAEQLREAMRDQFEPMI